jgi:hypothetical protein
VWDYVSPNLKLGASHWGADKVLAAVGLGKS